MKLARRAVVLAPLIFSAVACGQTGPLLKAEGPLTATADAVTTRGVDTLPAVYSLRIRNLLGGGEGICEVDVRRRSESRWSENQIVRPNTCYYLNEVIPISLPSGGDWFVRVKTSAGKLEQLIMRLTAATTETRIGG